MSALSDRPALKPYRGNPPYGILGGDDGDGGTFEDRSSPSSHPNLYQAPLSVTRESFPDGMRFSRCPHLRAIMPRPQASSRRSALARRMQPRALPRAGQVVWLEENPWVSCLA
jgi:hypothetical protein